MWVCSHALDQDNLSQKSMEIISSPVSSSPRQKISNSDDNNHNMFAFPNTINNNDDHETCDEKHSEEDNHTTFEFKFDHQQSGNSNSDSSDSPFKDSPADHIFRNGILLPHSFPVQPIYYSYGIERKNYSYQRSASRTSSVSSKDSLLSSRSNSTNSRSSSCGSSARTSVSDCNLDQKLLYNNAMKEYQKKRSQPLVLDQVYGSSRRWQFITPMPVITQETISSKRTKQKHEPQEHNTTKTKKIKTKKAYATGSASRNILRFCRRILSFCRECHALEPSIRSVSSIHEIPSQ